EPARLQYDLDHITDVAREIGAEYWVATPDDSDKQWVAAKGPLESRLVQVESVLPEVFRSSAGRVRVYALPCIRHPEEPACETADRVLFPTRSEPHAEDAALPGTPGGAPANGLRQ